MPWHRLLGRFRRWRGAPPHSPRVDSLTNYFHSEAFEDDLVVEPLVENARSLDAAARG